MKRIAAVLTTPPGLQTEDAQWSRLMLNALSSYREVLAVAPDDFDESALLAQGAIAISRFPRLCLALDLVLPVAAGAIAASAEAFGAKIVLLIDPPGMRLAPHLASLGASVRFLRRTDAQSDADSPLPPVDIVARDRDAARRLIGVAAGRPVLLAFEGTSPRPLLDAIDVIAANKRRRPMLVVAGESVFAARAMQRAELRGVADSLFYCGPVPNDKRSALFSSASAFLDLENASPGFGGHGSIFAAEAAAAGIPRLRRRAEIAPAIAAPPPPAAPDPAARGDVQSWPRWVEAGIANTAPHIPAPGKAEPQQSIAVFMATFNCRPWLECAIDSVIAQTHPHHRLFVVDDAGADLDGELLDKYPQVTFARLRKRLGTYGIANLLLGGTRSDLVAFHDADDWSAPSRLSEQADLLTKNAYDGVGTWSRLVDLNGDPIGFEARPVNAGAAMRRDVVDHVLHPTSLFRRSALTMLGGFDSSTRFSADTELHLRASLFVDLGNVPKFLYTRRSRPNSLTQSKETGYLSAARKAYIEPVYRAFTRQLRSPQPTLRANRTLTGKRIPAPPGGIVDWLRPSDHCDPFLAEKSSLAAGRSSKR